MATQLVTLTKFRRPVNRKFVQEASYGERGSKLSLSQCPVSHCQCIENLKSFEGGSLSRCADGEKSQVDGKIQRHRRGDDKRILHRLGLWFLASSVNYVLNKAKVLYHRIFCEAFDHPGMEIEASLVDAYFSIPVVSATTPTAPYVV